jgi:hypothetical protein
MKTKSPIAPPENLSPARPCRKPLIGPALSEASGIKYKENTSNEFLRSVRK